LSVYQKDAHCPHFQTVNLGHDRLLLEINWPKICFCGSFGIESALKVVNF
jgi:hypothetical protein